MRATYPSSTIKELLEDDQKDYCKAEKGANKDHIYDIVFASRELKDNDKVMDEATTRHVQMLEFLGGMTAREHETTEG